MLEDTNKLTQIWLFHGENADYTSAVFTDKIQAEQWITKRNMSGMLSAYPLNISIYEWTVAKGYFTPKKSWHHYPEYQANFTSASQEHYHFINGELQ